MSQRIHLDATPGLFHQVLHCHQGDVGRQFEIAVVTRDGYEIPSGATFKIQATKPSGLGFTVTGTAANNIISFTSTEDMTSEAGEIPTQLEIKSGNDVIYTSNFLLVCEKNTHPASVTDGSPEEIISEITLLVERAESAASTAGADAANAAQARVDEMMDYLPTEVSNLKSEINKIFNDSYEDISTPLSWYERSPGWKLLPTPTSSDAVGRDSTYTTYKYTVTAGQVVHILDCVSYRFFSASSMIVSNAVGNYHNPTDTSIIVPTGAINLAVTMLASASGFNNVYLQNSKIAKLEQTTTTLEKSSGFIQFQRGYTINTTGVGTELSTTPIATPSIDCAIVPCVEGQIFVLTGTPYNNSSNRPYLFADSNGIVVERGDISEVLNNYRIIAPCSGTAVFNFSNSAEYSVYSNELDMAGNVFNSVIKLISSTNLYDGNIVTGRYMNESGIVGNDGNMCYMKNLIPVTKGDWFVAGTGDNTPALLRFVTAYDSNKQVLSEKGVSGAYKYNVLEGVAFVKFTFYIADATASNFRLNRSPYLLPYESSDKQLVPSDYEVVENIAKMPLSTLPDYLRNTLAYVPLGRLTKPYICLVSDDGDEDMVTYSIPMVEAKGVPCTWAIMSTSEIFTSANSAADIAAVVDSVNNHNCAIAQHGGINWTQYNERDLNAFFDYETAFLASHGLTAKSAVCPSHYMNEMVCAVAGGRYGVCRSGGVGWDESGKTYEYLTRPYPNYTCGARSNIYGLTSQNVSNISQYEAQAVIDYAKANNCIAIFYWHENDLDATKKQRIEDAIDYAISQDIDFITLDQIRTVI